MLGLQLMLLSVGAVVGIHVEDPESVSEQEISALTSGLKAAVEERSGWTVTVDLERSACVAGDECAQEIRRRTEASDILLIRLIGVPTRIRLMAQRLVEGADVQEAEVDLPRAPDSWPTVLSGVAAELFPQVINPRPKVKPPPRQEGLVAPPPPTGPETPSSAWAPWLAVGVGAVALGVGIGFGLSSRSARDSAATQPHTPIELEDLEDRAIGHGVAANILLGTAVLGVGTGIVLLLIDD